jgi:hypothetical protein
VRERDWLIEVVVERQSTSSYDLAMVSVAGELRSGSIRQKRLGLECLIVCKMQSTRRSASRRRGNSTLPSPFSRTSAVVDAEREWTTVLCRQET